MPSCITKHNNRDNGYITKNKKEKLKDGLQNNNFPNIVKTFSISILKIEKEKIKKLNLYNFIFYNHARAFCVGDR